MGGNSLSLPPARDFELLDEVVALAGGSLKSDVGRLGREILDESR